METLNEMTKYGADVAVSDVPYYRTLYAAAAASSPEGTIGKIKTQVVDKSQKYANFGVFASLRKARTYLNPTAFTIISFCMFIHSVLCILYILISSVDMYMTCSCALPIIQSITYLDLKT